MISQTAKVFVVHVLRRQNLNTLRVLKKRPLMIFVVKGRLKDRRVEKIT